MYNWVFITQTLVGIITKQGTWNGIKKELHDEACLGFVRHKS